MKNIIKFIIGAIAILFGLYALIRIIDHKELTVGAFTLTFGITAIIWTIRAIKALSPGSSLRTYAGYFLTSLIFIVLFSIYHSLNTFFKWQQTIGDFMVLPEFMLITIAYMIFVISGYNMYKLGEEFGFQMQAKNIEKRIKNKKKKR
ncbi:hypothetical protein HYX17_04740 [Candidatus Woesearchaeota archaeon]|nr:hypothetical protein [Candidatus Woesearchaeota archaeon]